MKLPPVKEILPGGLSSINVELMFVVEVKNFPAMSQPGIFVTVLILSREILLSAAVSDC